MLRFIFTFLFVVALCCGSQAAEMRFWTGSNGKVIEAELIEFDGETVKLKLKNGKESNVLLSKFSKEDQEYLKKSQATDDPFADEKTGTTAASDEDRFLRICLDVSAQGQVKYRLEKTNIVPENNYDGRRIHPDGYPGVDIRAKKNGEMKYVFDFAQCELPTRMNRWGEKTVAVEDGLLRFYPEHGNNGKVLFAFRSLTSFPLSIVYDVKEISGECCYVEFFFVGATGEQQMGIFQVIAHDESDDEKFSVYFRFGNAKEGRKEDERWDFKEIFQKRNVTLENEVEGGFRIPSERKEQFERLFLGFGKNLNRPKNTPVDWEPIGISRIEVTGGIVP